MASCDDADAITMEAEKVLAERFCSETEVILDGLDVPDVTKAAIALLLSRHLESWAMGRMAWPQSVGRSGLKMTPD